MSTDVPDLVKVREVEFDTIATLVIAVIILSGAFFGLFRAGQESDKIIFGGLITMVGTFYFQRAATKAAHASTIEAQNNGLDTIRKTVGRIESGRTPTAAEVTDRDRDHGGGLA